MRLKKGELNIISALLIVFIVITAVAILITLSYFLSSTQQTNVSNENIDDSLELSNVLVDGNILSFDVIKKSGSNKIDGINVIIEDENTNKESYEVNLSLENNQSTKVYLDLSKTSLTSLSKLLVYSFIKKNGNIVESDNPTTAKFNKPIENPGKKIGQNPGGGGSSGGGSGSGSGSGGGSGSSNNPPAEVCGDGVVQSPVGEVCDDGNSINNDGCSALCYPELNLSIINPLNNLTYGFSPIQVKFNITDPGNKLSSCWYILNGLTTLINNCSSGVNTLNLSVLDGIHSLSVYANNSNNFVVNSSVDFLISITPVSVCGNANIEFAETCDGNSQACSVGSYSGSQSCNDLCTGFDSCTTTLFCGDSVVNGNEACDGDSRACIDVNSNVGSQSCNSQCTSYDSCVVNPCVLTSASWNSVNSVEGQTVTLTVTGNNCNNKVINFTVWEDDLLNDEAVGFNPASVTFVGNTSSASWVSEWQCDGSIGGVCTLGNPEYYFIATLVSGGSSITSSNQLSTSALSPTCMNGIVESGEECDDGNNINTDSCTNSCTNAICGDNTIHSGVEVCDGNSQACSVGGYSGSQSCNDLCTGFNTCVLSESCGDGVVQSSAGEQCDDGLLNGQPNRCNVLCTGITTSVCGNNVQESGEQCDDGNTNNNDACTNSCTSTFCGDSVVNGNEVCDEGLLNGQANHCNALCTGITSGVCGNSVVEQGEQCDDGNNVNTDSCTNSCVTAFCGDNIVRPGIEECDDGNGVDNDQCTNFCTLTYCGDGDVQSPNSDNENEVCDSTTQACSSGGYSGNQGCLNTCLGYGSCILTQSCGDGVVQSVAGEICDSNLVPCLVGGYVGTQLCNSQCNAFNSCITNLSCGDSVVNGNEICDDGLLNGQPNKCNALCTGITPSSCGNGVQEGVEQCDDGNTNNNDACTNSCTNAVCGDNILRSGVEQCDDGNIVSSDGCSSLCLIEQPTNSSNISVFNFEAENGVLKQPYTITTGYLKLGSGGTANYTFNVDVAGDYIVSGLVNAPDLGTNSIFVDIDVETFNDQKAWDILPLTSGFQNRNVSWRGNGTADAPQIPLKLFNLNIGQHTLILRGREIDTQIDKITIYKVGSVITNQTSVCGNLAVETGEVCDGNSQVCSVGGYSGSQSCNSLCDGFNTCVLSESCGDGVIQAAAGEQCDDGNLANGDGCSSSCQNEVQGPIFLEAENGLITGTNTVANGKLDLGSGGKAVYNFNLIQSGNYIVYGYVNAPDTGKNSFFVDIDTDPLVSDQKAWDINPITSLSGFELRNISQRGTGNPDVAEFSPKLFTLNNGLHQLIINGREPGTLIDNLTILRIGSAVIPSCNIGSVAWSAASVVNSTNVNMNLQGSNCNGQQFLFEVWEDDPLLDDFIVNVSGSYPSAVWKAIYDHGDSTEFGDSEYYFIARPMNNQSLSYTSGLLTVTLQATGPVCGNNIIEQGETCDDGNLANGDGCSSLCTIESSGVCGNGVIESGEQCDDGNTNDGDGCSLACILEGTASDTINLGVNVGNYDGNYEYVRNFMFVDVVKTSRIYGPAGGYTPEGWPIGNFDLFAISLDNCNGALRDGNYKCINSTGFLIPDISGTYSLSFKGQASVGAGGSSVQNIVYNSATGYTTGQVIVPSSEQELSLFFRNTNGQPITEIKLLRPGYSLGTTKVFTDEFVYSIEPFTTIRLMDYLRTNWCNENPDVPYACDSDERRAKIGSSMEWNERTLPSQATLNGPTAGSIELMVQLANEQQKDLWINIPHYASEDYIYGLANYLKNGQTIDGVFYPPLNSNSKVYLEYSNEVWNTFAAFEQSGTVRQMTQDYIDASPSNAAFINNPDSGIYYATRRFTVLKIFRISDIFREVFGDSQMITRIRPVFADQISWPGQAGDALNWAWRAYPHPPSYYIYGLAGAPYIGSPNNVAGSGGSSAAIVADELYDVNARLNNALLDFSKVSYTNHYSIAQTYGIKTLAYEGGTHLTDNVNVANKIGASYYTGSSPTEEEVIRLYLASWYACGGDLFMYFNHASAFGGEQWGLTEDVRGDYLRQNFPPKLKAARSVAQSPINTFECGPSANGIYGQTFTGARGNGTGLLGTYYNGGNFGSIALTRVEPVINFMWKNYNTFGPIPTTRTDGTFPDFSVRWTGKVMPKYNGLYRFELEKESGDISSVIVNGQNLGSDGTINLVAGNLYSIEVSYQPNGNGGKIRLWWSSSGGSNGNQIRAIIPRSQLYSS